MTAPPLVSRFRELHESGCFVLPNPWDLGSAKVLVQLGFKAVATTSCGLAWTLGVRDHAVTLEQKLAHLRVMTAAVPVPVKTMPLVTIKAAALELPEMFWIIFPVATRFARPF